MNAVPLMMSVHTCADLLEGEGHRRGEGRVDQGRVRAALLRQYVPQRTHRRHTRHTAQVKAHRDGQPAGVYRV